MNLENFKEVYLQTISESVDEKTTEAIRQVRRLLTDASRIIEGLATEDHPEKDTLKSFEDQIDAIRKKLFIFQ
jgi:hypothetical protein